MKHFCAFHRGINVNNIRLKMDDLSACYHRMGYQEVKTILASGNVICSTDASEMSLGDHKEHIEMALSLDFGYEAYVILKDLTQMDAILDEASHHVIPDGYHHYLMLTNDDLIGEALLDLFKDLTHAEHEQLLVETYGIYWIVPKGDTLQSDFGHHVLGNKTYKSRLTSRTMNTIHKVHTYMHTLD